MRGRLPARWRHQRPPADAEPEPARELSATDLAAVFAAMPTPYLVLSPDLRILDANPAYLATTGRARSELVDRHIFDAFPPTPNDTDADGGAGKVQASLERARRTGRPDTMPVQEYAIADEDGRVSPRFWSLIHVPVLDAGGACRYLLQRTEDITSFVRERARGVDDRAEGEVWRRRVLEVESDLFARGLELQAAREAESAAARGLAALAGVALEVAGAESVIELTRTVIDRGLAALGASGGALAVHGEPGQLQLTITDGLGQESQLSYGELPLDGPLPACVAARTGARVLLRDAAASLAFAPEMAEVIATTGCQAWFALPLRVGDVVLGSLTVGWEQPQEFGRSDVELVVAFSVQCAQALHRLLTREAEQQALVVVRGLAEALQRALLTEPPQPAGLQISVRYVPAAREAQVGGDWYDSFLLPDGRTTLVIGDVTGHDQEAAAAMAQVRNVLRGIASARPGSPAEVLRGLDAAMRDLGVGTYATAVLATIEQEPGTGRVFRWSNAGHPPPVLVTAAGAVSLLSRPADLLLGLDPDTRRAVHEVDLAPGSTVLLYTDGLVERRGESLDEGQEWLLDRVAEVCHLPLEEFCDRLLDALPGPVADDVAVLALRAER